MIQITILADKKPNPIIRDSRDTLIEEGLKVAYNQSGDVVLGVIKELKRSEYTGECSAGLAKIWWRLNFELHILNEYGNESKIKNPNSFVII